MTKQIFSSLCVFVLLLLTPQSSIAFELEIPEECSALDDTYPVAWEDLCAALGNRKGTTEDEAAAIYAQLSFLFSVRSDWPNALKWIDKALQIKEDFNLVLSRAQINLDQNLFEEALADYDRAIAGTDNKYFIQTGHYSKGFTYRLMGEHQKAIESLTLAIRATSDNRYYRRFLLTLRGNSYGKIGERKRALEDYSAALKIEKAFGVYAERCDSYFDWGDYENAKRDCRESLKLNEEQVMPNLILGNIAVIDGNTKDASAFYRSVLAIESDNEEALEALGQLNGSN